VRAGTDSDCRTARLVRRAPRAAARKRGRATCRRAQEARVCPTSPANIRNTAAARKPSRSQSRRAAPRPLKARGAVLRIGRVVPRIGPRDSTGGARRYRVVTLEPQGFIPELPFTSFGAVENLTASNVLGGTELAGARLFQEILRAASLLNSILMTCTSLTIFPSGKLRRIGESLTLQVGSNSS
jgi:hypothetical protein